MVTGINSLETIFIISHQAPESYEDAGFMTEYINLDI